MSYLAFGTITYNSNYSENALEDLAWKVFRKGSESSLFVFLSPNIPQKIVNEMLDEQCDKKDSIFSFFLTGSPIFDTSDSLISPPHFGESDLNSVYQNFSLIDNWIKAIYKYDDIVGIKLYLTEGYDDNFTTIKTNISKMYDLLKSEIDKYGDIPSLIVDIEK